MTRTTNILPRLVVALLLLSGAAAHAFVYDTEKEFTTSGDFDGDGRQDVVILDKASGAYRVGYFQPASNNYAWPSQVELTGIENVQSFSVGKLVSLTKDALVVSSPEANRIQVVDVVLTNEPPAPYTVYTREVGVTAHAVMDAGVSGNTAFEDLVTASAWNSPSPTNRIVSHRRQSASTFTDLGTNNAGSAARFANVVKLGAASATSYMSLLSEGTNGTAEIGIWTVAADVPALVRKSQTALPAGSRYTHGYFGTTAGTNVRFCAYTPGSNTLYVLNPQVASTTIARVPTAEMTFGLPVYRIYTIAGTNSPDRLLVLLEGGDLAFVYDFDGVTPPQLLQEIQASVGSPFTGVAVLPNGTFLMLKGDEATGISTGAEVYAFDGQSYVPTSEAALPALAPRIRPYTVMLFDKNPFEDKSAKLQRSLRAGQWSTNVTLAPSVSARVLSYVSPAAGLGNPATIALGAAATNEKYGAVNSYRSDVSMYNLQDPLQEPAVAVQISPEPGFYRERIKISFVAAAAVLYRFGTTGSFTPYTGSPLTLYRDTTVQFYAQDGTGARSALESAEYRFSDNIELLDADNDGVPDFVEDALGLDPIESGSDADGDGFSDLEELLLGSNPNSANSMPGGWTPTNGLPRPTISQRSTFDLVQVPKPYDGFTRAETTPITGQVAYAYDLSGVRLSTGKVVTAGIPGESRPAALLAKIDLAKDLSLISDSTENHYFITTTNVDKKIGRELVSLIERPIAEAITVPFVYSNRTPYVEATNWLRAARLAYSNAPPVRTTNQLDALDTLVSVLMERKIGLALYYRGVLTNTAEITLFPYRPTDVSRFRPDVQALKDLAKPHDYVDDGYRLPDLLTFMDSEVRTSTNADVRALRNFALDVYGISSRLHNVPPQSYRLPLDVLRDFINQGSIDDSYFGQLNYSNQYDLALSGAASILGNAPQRVRETLLVRVTETTYESDCLVVASTQGEESYSLIDDRGERYVIPLPFKLAVGSVLQVTGYRDGSRTTCEAGTISIEAVDVRLIQTPGEEDVDVDGNGIPDAWEQFFFGQIGVDPNGDPDRDAISNISEYYQGTDPEKSDFKSGGPSWWDARGVIDPYLPRNDYAGVLIGQLKHMVQQAALELNAKLPNGAGTTINNLVATFNANQNNYRAVNIGQLKYVAKPFYDRLITEGRFTGSYPWTTNGSDYALATIGQLKFVFNFDPAVTSAAPAAVSSPPVEDTETTPPPSAPAPVADLPVVPTFNSPSSAVPQNTDTTVDTDGDGISDYAETQQHHTDPNSTDTDRDGMTDRYETENGLNAMADDASADADGDGISNFREYLDGSIGSTNSQFSQRGFTGGATTSSTPGLASSTVDYQLLVELPGSSGTNRLGRCSDLAGTLGFEEGRGSAEYVFETTAPNQFQLRIEGEGHQDIEQRFPLRVFVDGCYLGRFDLPASALRPGTIDLPTPWLDRGSHTIRILWDAAEKADTFQLNHIQVYAAVGIDTDQDGMVDGVERQMFSESRIDRINQASAVSPVCVEGIARHRSLIRATGGLVAQGAPGQRWYMNVPLSPTTSTTLRVNYENGAAVDLATMTWVTTDILTATNLTIRKNDALLFTCLPAGATNGSSEIRIGDDIATLGAGDKLVRAFQREGVFTVIGKYTSALGTTTNRSITVTVVDAAFAGDPAVWVDQTRVWDCPDLPDAVSFESDEHVTLASTGLLPGGGQRMTLASDLADPSYVVARLGPDGPILDNARVDGFRLLTSLDTYVEVIETFTDGSSLRAMGMVFSPAVPSARFVLSIFVGGVVFDDGSLVKTLTATDFDALGRKEIRFLRPATATSSVCHITEGFQDTVYLGSADEGSP